MTNRIQWTATSFVCDTCNRSIKLPTNSVGITVVTNCSITHGCKGRMGPVATTSTAVVSSLPPDVAGVANWQQRQVLQTHTQTVSALVWTFKYQLTGTPLLHVYAWVNDVLTEISEYTYSLTGGVVTITMPGTYAGIVQCVTAAPSTQLATTAATTSSNTQVSSDAGDITIATLDTADQIGVTVMFHTQGSQTPIEYFNIGIGPASTSPWTGVSTALINGRKYHIRSFNIHTAASSVEYFSTGIVSSGTPLHISTAGSLPVALGTCLLLLGKPPYGFVDRIYDQQIDAASISTTQPQLYYADGCVFTSTNATKAVYPPILVI